MKGLVLVAAAALAVAALLGGGAPLSRVLLAMGMPKLAAPLFTDAEWQGVALYRAGEFDAAARAFSEARSFYNLGNAEAHRGQYAAALEAFDLADARRDPDARANFDVVAEIGRAHV